MATSELPRDDLVVYLRKLEARIAIIEQRSPLANTGLSVPGVGVTQVDGALNVVGTETVSGNLNVSGAAAITGTLSLPAGVIDNAALANPISTHSTQGGASGGGLPAVTKTEMFSVTVTIPAGFTSVALICTAVAMAVNSTATGDYLYTGVVVDGVNMGEVYQAVGPGLGASVISSVTRTLAVVGGQVVSVAVEAHSSTNPFAAYVANQYNVYVFALFYR